MFFISKSDRVEPPTTAQPPPSGKALEYVYRDGGLKRVNYIYLK